MKVPICLALVLLAVVPGRAQLFGPNAAGGTLLGGVAGGIIGYNNHHQTGAGVAIGAASGFVLGSLVDQANYDSYQRTAAYRPAYYGYQAYSQPGYVYRTDYCYDSYGSCDGYDYSRPNHILSGTLLGGLAGGIIGYNNHYQTGRGILIGAASGALLSAIADGIERNRETRAARTVVVSEPAQPAPAPAPQTAPAATVSAPSSSMSDANALFGRN